MIKRLASKSVYLDFKVIRTAHMKKSLMLVVVIALVAYLLPFVRAAIMAALILSDFLNPQPDNLFRRFASQPAKVSIAFKSSNRNIRADLYKIAANRKTAGVLLVHGLNEWGKEDPRLVELAERLARAGFVVLVPDFLEMKRLRAKLSEVEDIVNSFHFLSLQRDYVAEDKCGMIGFSYGAGPTLLAAADPRIKDKVKFLVSFGGYYELENCLLFLTTGYHKVDEKWQYLPPRRYAKWYFILANPELVENENDRELLGEIARLKSENENANVDSLASRLGAEGKRVYDFLTNRDPSRFQSLLNGLSDEVKVYLKDLSPSRVLDKVKAYVLIGHGIDDDAIPYTESLKLAEALRKHDREVHATIMKLYIHVDLDLPERNFKNIFSFYIPEAIKFWYLIYDLMLQQLS